MKADVIIQARMTSTRLPGKILMPVLDKPLLKYQIERLRRAKSVSKIIIATTENKTDDPIIEFCKSNELLFYRGSENDVLSRYYDAATKYDCHSIVRITSDCPVIDPVIVDKVIDFFFNSEKKCDYASNCLVRTFPRGMDTEVFTYQALARAFKSAVEVPDREHVTPYIYRNPGEFNISNITDANDNSCYRLTVDTSDDFELIKRIIESLYPKNPFFSLNEILTLMSANPEWFKINMHIEQKKYGQ